MFAHVVLRMLLPGADLALQTDPSILARAWPSATPCWGVPCRGVLKFEGRKCHFPPFEHQKLILNLALTVPVFSQKNQQNTHKLQNLFINIPIRTTITIITVLIILEQRHIGTTTGNVPNVSLHSKSLVEHRETDHNDSKVKC